MVRILHIGLSSCLMLIVCSLSALAQQGTLSGNIIDAETGEELIGATVQVQETGDGTVADISGNYQLSLDPGTYTLLYSYVSYASKTVEGVEVKAGEINRIDISLQSDDVQLQEVVVQAEQINNNEVSLLKLQQKALAVQDGISIGEMRKIGATNSADALKNVTGASVEDGKYVVMRGLGDRYSNTQMNGITMPSTDPYRNSASLDMIPSTVIENVVTTKTFTPDQPGNFTGGNVNVSTRSIPDQFYLSTGISVGYNTQASFEDNFLTDPVSGNTDWLGYGGSAREIPEVQTIEEPFSVNLALQASENPENAEARNLISQGVDALASRSFVPATKRAFLNYRAQISFGDRIDAATGSIGYNVALNYRRNYTHYDNRILNIWEYPASGQQATELQDNVNTKGTQSADNPSIGSLIGIAYQLNNRNELALNYTYNNDTEIGASVLEGVAPGLITNRVPFITRNISYVQRQVNNVQLKGGHSFGGKNVKLDWVLGYTLSTQDEPDTRVFANQIDRQGYRIDDAAYDRPFHFDRELIDNQYSGKVDLELPLGNDNQHRFKAGIAARRKERNFTELRYQHEENRLNNNDFLTFREADGDFDAFFARSNFGIQGQNPDGSYRIGPYFIDQSEPSNIYTGTEQVLAGYLMGVYQATSALKFIGGVRAETTEFEVETNDPSDEVGVIDELDFLPSLNTVYALNDKSNVRIAGSRTLARPNMREVAPFSSFDFIGGFIYVGNPQLGRSTVWNIDARYELFPRAGEVIAASVFYKQFNDPIQQRITPNIGGSINEISFVNVDQGILYGLELELRKSLDFISTSFFEKLKVGVNFTYTQSQVDLEEAERVARQTVNPTIEDTRPFQAQSPYIVNVNLDYLDVENDFEVTLYMNMFGRRLFANGNGGIPDIYEIYGSDNIPTPDLRLIMSKGIFENFNIGFRAENILDYQIERNVDFNGNYSVQERFNPGRTFTVSLNYAIE